MHILTAVTNKLLKLWLTNDVTDDKYFQYSQIMNCVGAKKDCWTVGRTHTEDLCIFWAMLI